MGEWRRISPGWYPDPIDYTLQRWWDGSRWSEHVTRDGSTWRLPLPATAPAVHTTRRRTFPIWAWILIGLLVIVPALLLSPFVAAAALVVAVTGIFGLSKGSRTWLRFRSRRAAASATAVATVAFLLFGGVAAAAQAGRTNPPVEAVGFADTGSRTDSADANDTDPVPTPTPTPVTLVEEELVKEAVAFESTTVNDPTMTKGETKVTTVGRPGERTLTYRVTLVDGEETKRELVSDVVTTDPVTEVTSVGTYVAPAPAPAPAQPAGCDSNYADACVPIASDVDCAWGSGNGPAYFDGVARVVGSDIYGLDRDGDGLACER